jgi:hypothetical protein
MKNSPAIQSLVASHFLRYFLTQRALIFFFSALIQVVVNYFCPPVFRLAVAKKENV